MEQEKNKKRVWKGIFRIVLLSICGMILGLNLYQLNANRLVGNQLPMPFGYGAAVVLSGSMEPEFSKGDLIFVKETLNYDKNDIVVFQDGNTLVVHRIIEMDEETVTTKGDANNTADDPITKDLIKGEVIGCVPFIGEIVNWIKTPLGTLVVAAGAIALVEIPRRREKQRDDDERQKIIDEIKKLKDQVQEVKVDQEEQQTKE